MEGYYWIKIKDCDPEVVQIDGDSMYRAGSDVTCAFADGKWWEFGQDMEVEHIGPRLVPDWGY